MEKWSGESAGEFLGMVLGGEGNLLIWPAVALEEHWLQNLRLMSHGAQPLLNNLNLSVQPLGWPASRSSQERRLERAKGFEPSTFTLAR